MSRPPATPDIDPRAIAAEFFRKLGGLEGMTKWGRTHRSLAYQLIAKLMAQPLVQTNIQFNNVKADGEAARRKLEDALLRVIESRKYENVDPAVFVNGERLEPLTIDHKPLAVDPRLGTPDAAPGSFENLKSAKKGPLFLGGGVATTPAEGKKKSDMYSDPIPRMPSPPGFAAGGALDESADDNLSTTEKWYRWKERGGGGPP
jgi:hypothetical protein